MDVKQVLEAAIGTGELITIIYSGGSRPNSSRLMLPIKVKDDRVWAWCFHNNDVRTFLFDKMTIIDNPDGVTTYDTTPSTKVDYQYTEKPPLDRLRHYVSPEFMNITGLGNKLTEALYNNGALKTIADIYKLTAHDIMAVDGKGETSAKAVLNVIEASKKTTLRTFLGALGIPEVGSANARSIVDYYGDLFAIASASVDELLQVPDVGIVTALNIVNFFQDTKNQAIIAELIAAGVTWQQEQRRVKKSLPLDNQTWVITGTLNSPRREIKSLLENLGATVANSVTRKTTCLLVGIDAGSKLDKAYQLNIRAIDEATFWIEIVSEALLQLTPEVHPDGKTQQEQASVLLPLTGHLWVITGTLSVPRREMQLVLEGLGATVTNSVTRQTTCVLAGVDAGSKLTKAHELGIRVVDEATWWAERCGEL